MLPTALSTSIPIGLHARAVRNAVAGLVIAASIVPTAASAQAPTVGEEPDSTVYLIDPVVVTATRGPRAVSTVPAPVSVIQRRELVEKVPNTISDLFRTMPGLDVTGVGASQVRPQIRGQTGQRILTLTDGMRLNNTRREKSFGELLAIVELGSVEQVEVVRGPASVLYGSDAIGGVVNIITEGRVEDGFRQSLSYSYGSAADQSRFSLRVDGRAGSWWMNGGASRRSADSYQAPAGSFGDITLVEDVTVEHTGVDDRNVDLRIGYDLNESAAVFLKGEFYGADDAGFGYVAPESYAPGYPRTEALYPEQRFGKLTGGLRARDLGFVAADEVNLTGYAQDNERELVFDGFIPFFPGAGLDIDSRNFTDIRTYGFRAEARKLVASRVLMTYGVDGFRDGAEGTDESTQIMTGFGPPQVTNSDVPSLPHAEFLSLGAFVQAEFDIGDRLSFVTGGRYQDVDVESFVTPNLATPPTSASHGAWVGAVNALLDVGGGVEVVASTGRAFRSPNLIELFFDGPVTEEGVYQIASPDLEAETSFNVDVGLRYTSGDVAGVGNVFAEGFYFRNKVKNGIRSRPLLVNGVPVETQGMDTYQNVNVDEIILDGFELNADFIMDYGITFGASFSKLNAEDAIDSDNPIGESYSKKLLGRLGYRASNGRYWGEWEIRHSGEQKDAEIDSTSPVGTTLPAFTVQNARVGVRLAKRDGFTTGLTLALSNLTDRLYAETANASFFRPEPGRNVSLAVNVSF